MARSRLRWVGLALLCSHAGCAQEIAGRVSAVIESRFAGTHCPGLSVAVSQHNQIVYSRGFGWADLEQKVPMSERSVHRLASVSKLITATIVMELAQSERLRLDTPATQYLPELPPPYRKVTVRHLLAHQAGVRNYRDLEEVFSMTHYATSRDAVKAFTADPLRFEPGSKVEYSTFGFTLLGAVVEAVTARPFHDAARDFFRHNGIEGMDLDDARAIVPHRVRGYLVGEAGIAQNARFYDASNKYPAGGFTGSAADTLRFAIAVGTGKILDNRYRDQMWTVERAPFGLGWGISERAGHKMVGFNGLQPMTETAVRYFPRSGDGVAVFCNAEGARGLSEIVEAITDLLVAGADLQ